MGGGRELGVGQSPFALEGAGRVHGQPDAAHRDADPGADLEQLETIVLRLAFASFVLARPMRRSAQIST